MLAQSFSPVAAALASALAITGCASSNTTVNTAPHPQSFSERNCVRSPAIASVRVDHTRSSPGRSAQATLPADIPFSQPAIDTARAIGALPDLITVATQPSDHTQLTLAARQNLLARITLAMLDVASVTGEIDCEDERTAQLRDQLRKAEEQRLRSLTVAGLVLGAATAIVSGGIALANPDAPAAAAVSVVGGSAQAGAGYAALTYAPKGQLLHERNLLADVWQGKSESDVFPATVWRFLTQSRAQTNEAPLRQTLIAQWRAGERFGPAGSEEERQRIALIFGKGGEYSIEDLSARDAVLDQLEAVVKLLYQDLGLLLRELSALSLPTDSARP